VDGRHRIPLDKRDSGNCVTAEGDSQRRDIEFHRKVE
jgi:hypothetical protein